MPKNLERFMHRDRAEAMFKRALKKERFLQSSLFSYYFNEGWMEFALYFDNESKLRRLYVNHKDFDCEEAIEIRLKN